jgi:hypothetical protein
VAGSSPWSLQYLWPHSDQGRCWVALADACIILGATQVIVDGDGTSVQAATTVALLHGPEHQPCPHLRRPSTSSWKSALPAMCAQSQGQLCNLFDINFSSVRCICVLHSFRTFLPGACGVQGFNTPGVP